MRKQIFIRLIVGLVTLSVVELRAQGVWTQKANFGGGGRRGAISFSIGDKGYFGTGYTGSVYTNDLWEYDSTMNAWSQKASLPDTARTAAIGFSIGLKGYLALGFDPTTQRNLISLWEWDQSSNMWTKKANFPGPKRRSTVGFSIGSKGYLGTGWDGDIWTYNVWYNDFWEWDQGTDTWVQKNPLPGGIRGEAIGFSIGTKGYIGLGHSFQNNMSNFISYDDFWEWNSNNNTWVQKANFGGGARDGAVGFSIGTNGYAGLGQFAKDFWEWDPTTGTWIQAANFGGSKRREASGFSIGTKGYIGLGFDTSYTARNDFWEYTPDSTLGIKEITTTLSCILFPNPMREEAQINFKSKVQNSKFEFELYDLQGKLVRNFEFETSNLPTGQAGFKLLRGNLAPGTYIYKVSSPDGAAASGKLVIQ